MDWYEDDFEDDYLGSGFVGGARFTGKPTKSAYVSMLSGKYVKQGMSKKAATEKANQMWEAYSKRGKSATKKAPVRKAPVKKASTQQRSAKALARSINKDSAELVRLLS